jgi:purine-binding chemotaxis protein CheW
VNENRPPAASASVQRILEERARALARPSRSDDAPDTAELVVMDVGSERYGVDAERVLEVRHLAKLAPVPGTPQFWAGVVSIRGTLYPVLDLRRYLSLPGDDPAEAPKKVVLVSGAAFPSALRSAPGAMSKGSPIGLMVDEATGVRRVPAAAIDPPMAGASETLRDAVRGVTADVLTILDVDAVLSDPRLVVKETPT